MEYGLLLTDLFMDSFASLAHSCLCRWRTLAACAVFLCVQDVPCPHVVQVFISSHINGIVTHSTASLTQVKDSRTCSLGHLTEGFIPCRILTSASSRIHSKVCSRVCSAEGNQGLRNSSVPRLQNTDPATYPFGLYFTFVEGVNVCGEWLLCRARLCVLTPARHSSQADCSTTNSPVGL